MNFWKFSNLWNFVAYFLTNPSIFFPLLSIFFSDCILEENIFFILCNLADRYPIRKHYYSITRSSGSSAIVYGSRTPTGKLSQILGNRERSIEKLHKGFGITILWDDWFFSFSFLFFSCFCYYCMTLLDRWIQLRCTYVT